MPLPGHQPHTHPAADQTRTSPARRLPAGPAQASLKDQADGGGLPSSSSAPEGKDNEAGSSSGGGGDSGGDSSAAASASDDPDETPPWSWRQFAACCGSGLLMSVAYLVSGVRGNPWRVGGIISGLWLPGRRKPLCGGACPWHTRAAPGCMGQSCACLAHTP